MKRVKKDEVYQNLSGFLADKGIELKPGSYTQKIQSACQLLTEAINLGQQGLDRAKAEIDRKLERMRQVIHEKTAPRQPATSASPPPPPATATAAPRRPADRKARRPAAGKGSIRRKSAR
jgi:hypothetical protein